MKTIVSSDKAPPAAAFYSQAVLTKADYTLELAGQVGMDPSLGPLTLVDGWVAAETEQCFANIGNILSEIGWDLTHITKVRVYLTSMSDYGEMNEVYKQHFTSEAPARVCVAVKELPLGAKVEIECTAQGNAITS